MIIKGLFIIYLITIVVANCISIYRKVYSSEADKWISFLLAATLLFEIISEVASHTLQNNMYVYHVWSPIQLFLICSYFNDSIKTLKRHRTGYILGCLGILVAIVNASFIQPPSTLNSIFLLYEGFIVIGLCLYAFYNLASKDVELTKNVHFWFTTILLIYWSVVYVYWGMYKFMNNILSDYIYTIMYTMMSVNILAYAAIAIILLNYRKMISTSG